MSRRRPRAAGIVLAVLLGAAVTACGDETVEGPPPSAPERIRLTSPAFAPGAAIPFRFTCDGEDVSPPLQWSGVPAEARSLALLLEDPDAPGGTFVHWTLFAIAPTATALREGQVPAGAPEGDEPHRYVFVLYGLRSALELDAGASPEQVRAAIAERAIARGELTARFG